MKTELADRIVGHVQEHGLEVEWILETHAHADHLSAARHLKRELGGRIGIGARICEVQRMFKDVFNLERTFNTDGSQFDQLFEDGAVFPIGRRGARLYTPGHTPACSPTWSATARSSATRCSCRTAAPRAPISPAAMPQRSTARSQKILALSPATRLFICHDYQPGGREMRLGDHGGRGAGRNIHIGNGRSEAEFVAMRTARDKTLSMPALLIPSIQINIRAGELPPPEDNGVPYIKVPLNRI